MRSTRLHELVSVLLVVPQAGDENITYPGLTLLREVTVFNLAVGNQLSRDSLNTVYYKTLLCK